VKKLLFMFAALAFIAAPLLAQEAETLPDGRKVKIVQKDGVTIIEEVEETEESEESEDSAERERSKIKEVEEVERDLPEEIRDILKRVRVHKEERKTDDDWEEDSDWDGEMPEDFRKTMEEMRKRMEEFRKDHEERFKKIREELEKNAEEWESDPEAEVEEYESEDGSVKIKIVRIRKVAKSGEETPKEPAAPKKETERKQ